MKRHTWITLLLIAASFARGFTPHAPGAQLFIHVVDEIHTSRKATKKAPVTPHKDGIFSPCVYCAKDVLGDTRLNKVRGRVIALHMKTIRDFVNTTSDSRLGSLLLKLLFVVADQNGNGKIEQEELERALHSLGFRFLKKKHIQGIFDRAGGKDKKYITLKEWMKEAPKTLKTNLIKLAKANGGELGLLV